MIPFMLMWMGAALASDCAEPTTSVALLETLGQADSAFVELNLDAFQAAADQAQLELTCLGEPLVPADAAAVHRFQALVAFVGQRDQDVRLAYSAAAALHPEYTLSMRVAPDGHPLRAFYDDGARLPPGPELQLDKNGLVVDGTRTETLVTGRPAVLQLQLKSGAIDATEWVGDTSEGALPDWVVLAPPVPDRPPRPKLKLGKPFAIAGGASAVIAGSLYVTSWATRARYLNEETSMDKLEGLKKTNHGTLVGAGVFGGLAVGFGSAAWVVEW